MPLKTLIEEDHSLDEIWKVLDLEFQKSCSAKRHPFRYVVFSTSKEGKSNSRWVVLRKFTERSSFLIYTDARSGKVGEVRTNNFATLLFYNERKKLQVKVQGDVVIHQENELTEKYWPGVQGASAKAYTTKLAPGEPIENKEKGYDWTASGEGSHFTILEVFPSAIEALQLNGERHIRVQYLKGKSDNWNSKFLVP
jgi:pyridoxine/pyridoxamine 5'-phosphate oxidase